MRISLHTSFIPKPKEVLLGIQALAVNDAGLVDLNEVLKVVRNNITILEVARTVSDTQMNYVGDPDAFISGTVSSQKEALQQSVLRQVRIKVEFEDDDDQI